MPGEDSGAFSRGVGLPYRAVFHLLRGSEKPHFGSTGPTGDPCFLDENLRGYSGWEGDDRELVEINEMEAAIGSLSQEIRDLRTMVDFCCIWRYDYPARVHQICEAIGGKTSTVGRCHYQVGTDKRDELSAYACALNRWLGKKYETEGVSLPDRRTVDEVQHRVNSMLGDREAIKNLLVERTLIGLSSRHIDCSFFGSRGDGKPEKVFPSHALNLGNEWRQEMKTLERGILKRMGGKAYDFLCEVGGAEPPCHFKFIRRLEILVSSIGCLSWRGCLPPKDGRVSGRRQVTRQYLAVLQKYWTDGAGHGTDQGDPQRSPGRELFEALGDHRPFKRWLVAALWKNIKNQTEHQAFTMKHWVEFVQIVRSRMSSSFRED